MTTVAPSDPSKKNLTRTRMGIYIASALMKAMRPFTDAPNVAANHVPMRGMTINFLEDLKKAASNDPNHMPHVEDYAILDESLFNSASEKAAGDYTLPIDVKVSSAQERIFLSIQHGESVVVKAA